MVYQWKCKCCEGTGILVRRDLKDYKKKPKKSERPPWCEGKGWERVIEATSIKTGDGFKL